MTANFRPVENAPDMSQTLKAERFRALHQGLLFVLPNPWDAGSARLLASMGFAALATTSAGLAFSLGRRDAEIGRASCRERVSLNV